MSSCSRPSRPLLAGSTSIHTPAAHSGVSSAPAAPDSNPALLLLPPPAVFVFLSPQPSLFGVPLCSTANMSATRLVPPPAQLEMSSPFSLISFVLPFFSWYYLAQSRFLFDNITSGTGYASTPACLCLLILLWWFWCFSESGCVCVCVLSSGWLLPYLVLSGVGSNLFTGEKGGLVNCQHGPHSGVGWIFFGCRFEAFGSIFF